MAGDTKTPDDFLIDGCDFISLEHQKTGEFTLGRACPERSYTRKNIAYLHAISSGASVIVETDDDNHPYPEFWIPRTSEVECATVSSGEWVNVYGYFSGKFVYPRGLPLQHARTPPPEPQSFMLRACPVQQGLADDDPDVDAVYRMLFELPIRFDKRHSPVFLAHHTWCPFNSQNTTFFRESFPLLYLPSMCSFRMTDIWRSFVAQRILHARSSGILFYGPTVWQTRNDHDFHRDFLEEIPGYMHNEAIRDALLGVGLTQDLSSRIMLEKCYEVLMHRGWIEQREEAILSAWLNDLDALGVR